MKYLLLGAVVLGLIWLLRSRRPVDRSARGSAASGRRAGGPQPMVTCAHCGVHLPREDAVQGNGESYCSDAHRQARGDGV